MNIIYLNLTTNKHSKSLFEIPSVVLSVLLRSVLITTLVKVSERILFLLLHHLTIILLVLHVHLLLVGNLILLRLTSALSEYNNLVLCLSVLPSSEDKQMGSDCSGGMAEARVGWLSHILSTSPAHAISRPDHEIVAFISGRVRLVLIAGS